MIMVLPERSETGDPVFRAVLGDRFAIGKSVGSAVDALTDTVENARGEDESLSSTVIWVQKFRADRFFNEQQRERLSTLMTKFHAATDSGSCLDTSEQAELEALIEAETRAMTDRTEAFLKNQK